MITPVRLPANDIHQEPEIALVQGCGEGLAVLAEHPLFMGLGEDVLAVLANAVPTLHAADGDWLFREGGPARHCLLVMAGQVEVLRISEDGQERICSLFERGQLVAEAALFMPHGRYPMSARARGEVQAVRLPRAGVRAACAQHPVLAMRFLDWLGCRIYQRTNEIDWLTGTSAAQRLAAHLLSLQTAGGRVRIPVSRQQLAGKLGIRPETLSRMLSDWQRQGHLEGRGRELVLFDAAFFLALSGGARRLF